MSSKSTNLGTFVTMSKLILQCNTFVLIPSEFLFNTHTTHLTLLKVLLQCCNWPLLTHHNYLQYNDFTSSVPINIRNFNSSIKPLPQFKQLASGPVWWFTAFVLDRVHTFATTSYLLLFSFRYIFWPSCTLWKLCLLQIYPIWIPQI